MWNNTRLMAEAIAAGISSVDKDVTIKLFSTSRSDKNDSITEVFKSKAILVGSPTVNKGILYSVAGTLELIKGLGFKNKKAAAFGSYGWSGENIKLISQELEKGGFEVIDEGIRVLWNPDEDGLNNCQAFGRRIAELVK